MRSAFGTVVYPGAIPYLDRMLCSISEQTVSDFNLIIVLDCVSCDVVCDVWNGDPYRLEFVIASGGGISENRIDLLRAAKRLKYDYLILGDADDWFSRDRIEKSIETLSRGRALAFNELRYPKGTPVFSGMIPDYVQESDILDCNFLGLSNTALNMRALSDSFIESLASCESNVFDWYLFSRVLNLGETGERVPDAVTFYRLHDANVAGAPGDEAVKEALVKTEHYRLMESYGEDYRRRLRFYSAVSPEGISALRKPARFWWDGIGVPGNEWRRA